MNHTRQTACVLILFLLAASGCQYPYGYAPCSGGCYGQPAATYPSAGYPQPVCPPGTYPANTAYPYGYTYGNYGYPYGAQSTPPTNPVLPPATGFAPAQ